MSCPDCLNNCSGVIVPDKCVQSTIPDNEMLGTCSTDSLYEFNQAVISYLVTVAAGTAITLEPTTCAFTDAIHAESGNTLPELIQTIFTALCSINTEVTDLNEQVNSGFSFNTDCLEDLTGTSTRDEILQAVIDKVCESSTTADEIAEDYVKASELCTKVNACLASSGSTNYSSRMVPNAPIPYIGSLSNFDNTGKGIAANGFSKIYLMNGLNGTQDWRGRSPIGAVQNVPGASLDSIVDPSLVANSGTNYTINQKVGQSKVTQTIATMPPHTHVVTDPGHSHTYLKPKTFSNSDTPGAVDYVATETGTTASSNTNISIASAGQGVAHTVVHPSVACYYIVYIP